MYASIKSRNMKCAWFRRKNGKNSILTQIANFHTEKLQGAYYKHKKSGAIGQIDKVYWKGGTFFAHVYRLDVTTNSKVRRMYYNIPFNEEEMKELTVLTEEEYKNEFFCFVNPCIKAVEQSLE